MKLMGGVALTKLNYFSCLIFFFICLKIRKKIACNLGISLLTVTSKQHVPFMKVTNFKRIGQILKSRVSC